MPLPLPNLDTRRWSDLVDEGRALIPRFAPAWTDHNIHDPGVTLIELFAYLTEELLYRANRIPDRHRRKFLALLGYAPNAPQPASCILGATLSPGSGSIIVPHGTVFVADAGAGVRLPFHTRDDASLVEAQLAVIQSYDGKRFHDRSRAARELLPLHVFGPNPLLPHPYVAAKAPALLLGFDRALPKNVPVRLYFRFAGAMRNERQRLLDEAAEIALDCVQPLGPCEPRCPPKRDPWCSDVDPAGAPAPVPSGTSISPTLPPHHSVRTVWEYLAADGWHALDPLAGDVDDRTRGLTLDGLVTLRIPGDMAATAIGVVVTPRFYVRCRLLRGAYDSAPVLLALTMNALITGQAMPAIERYTIAATVVPVGAIAAGLRSHFSLDIDESGVIQRIEAGVADADAPELLVVDFTAPSSGNAGEITLDLVRLASGTGLPEQHPVLPDAPVSLGRVVLRTLEATGAASQHWVDWTQRLDLDSAKPTDRRFALAPTTGELHFGDGVRGRVVPQGAPILAQFESTAASGGALAAARAWALADIALNHAVLGPLFTPLASATVSNAFPSDGGADEEDIGAAATRAASALWSHERLVRLCPNGECATLDQIERASVLDLPEPDRATTLLDFERIALEVPGTRVRRARAWAELDPAYPGLEASGTVTVVVVPELPFGKPQPSAGLLRALRRWLDRRRVLCTRLVVVGPEYITVSVSARVRAASGADPSRVHADVVKSLETFLDPLIGGPASRGWPFGRDVYRSEILQVIDQVRGVDHVLELTISADGRDVACGNLCVPPTWLVTSGVHSIEVATT
ncbi:MAG: baseplate J/gp47 family protein [Gemmatimonadaceae bacterium]